MEPVEKSAREPFLKKGWQWPVLIVAMLALSATFDMCFVALATGHPALAAEEDYYERGQSWDRDRAEAKESGLRLELETGPAADGRAGFELVTVRLVDGDAKPADAARVQLTAFHVAHPRVTQILALQAQGDGAYSAAVDMARPGAWCLRFEVERGGLHLREERTVSVPGRR